MTFHSSKQSNQPDGGQRKSGGDIGGRYAGYVLAVLTIVYVFNILDRQILSILAEDIRKDLGLDDAQLGFLYGTAFAVFYAGFGIPLGRLADVWNRSSVISIGLAFWSLMTAVSGLARNFVQIAVPRVGVGIGEASASPAAYSILSDYFPPAKRATALAIYSSGIYLGVGFGLMLGGHIADGWNDAWPSDQAPLGLAGWQVAFFAVGTPGLLLALLVRTLREPKRGQSEGLSSPEEPHPFRQFLLELRSILPPFTVFHLWVMAGDDRRRALVTGNLAGAAAIAASATGLIVLTGDFAQWIALGIGCYAAFSWMQALGLRDRPTSVLILRTRSLRYAVLGFSFLSFSGYVLAFWATPYFLRVHDVSKAMVGTGMGASAAAGGWLGITLGGILADHLRRRSVNGRLHVAMLNAIVPVPFVLGFLFTDDVQQGYIWYAMANLFGTMWIGAGASTVQDLVLPRMRASAAAFFLLINTFIGLALGPYIVGKISDVTGSLRTAILLGLIANAIACGFLLLAMRHLGRDEKTRIERAEAAGETGLVVAEA